MFLNWFSYESLPTTFERGQNFFEIEVYISNNFFLPSDSLLLNVNSPSFEVNDLTLTKTNKNVDVNIPNIQYDTSNVYITDFSLDISSDEFFNGTSDKYFDLNLSFGFNPNSLKNDNNEIDINNFNDLLNEIKLSRIIVPFYHQNRILVNKNDYYEHVVSIESNSRKIINLSKNKLFFELNNFEYADEPIKKLFNIRFDKIENIIFKNVELDLNYSINNQIKSSKLKFESELNLDGKNIIFELNNYETYFNNEKKEVFFQKGSNGIYFPFNTYGEYEISFDMLIRNKPVNYKVRNKFNYYVSENNVNFIVENLTESLVNYEEIYI